MSYSTLPFLNILGDSGWISLRAGTPDTAPRALAVRRFFRAGDTTLVSRRPRNRQLLLPRRLWVGAGRGGLPLPPAPR